MRRLPHELLASIPNPSRRAASTAALSLRKSSCKWSTYGNDWRYGVLSLPPSFRTTLPSRRPLSLSAFSLIFAPLLEPHLSTSTSEAAERRPPPSPPRPLPSGTFSTHSGSEQSSESAPACSSSSSPFRFETGIGLFAKRAPRPFPPPFLSPPSGSFSDPLSTHHSGRARSIRGRTNGDDAVYASDCFVCANDGVGAWSTRPKGHAGLWARLILHFWVSEIHEDKRRPRPAGEDYVPNPIDYLQRAYEHTLRATDPPNDWQGTTTACGAQLHYRRVRQDGNDAQPTAGGQDRNEGWETPSHHFPTAADSLSPLLYVTNLGDSQVMVVRPSSRTLVYKTTEQWHWFDCPRQLGTNSPDTPLANAVMDVVPIQEGDVVLAMTDGVIDNLWAHEIVESVSDSIARWEAGEFLTPRERRAAAAIAPDGGAAERKGGRGGGMAFVAQELMEAAKLVALDPYAESPFMEHSIEEGLASQGGKLDDISVVAALCTRSETH
ncbi:hypothetical protein VTK73DRAFT_2627 [Phialemonium thermophilum]|uniref:Protein phosphatase n=1 Tax=Phialemonium thermophilum TaxID=223376 RepID=A0ABR3X3K5_9PEZI